VLTTYFYTVLAVVKILEMKLINIKKGWNEFNVSLVAKPNLKFYKTSNLCIIKIVWLQIVWTDLPY